MNKNISLLPVLKKNPKRFLYLYLLLLLINGVVSYFSFASSELGTVLFAVTFIPVAVVSYMALIGSLSAFIGLVDKTTLPQDKVESGRLFIGRGIIFIFSFVIFITCIYFLFGFQFFSFFTKTV